ncbi:hypothetical protein KSC_048310 [Ktedonobacter sp. SOSP1-52]|uniref:hypothetical protein n=1 Tax=Ktedonobacter sp. SOSP1-52 TaxID=2778366 RepID=UPI0019154E53|nr:hypothetical protein [Ktedonobacter sp. SOSP1-52]GHO65939.1 hypothetical protein KSC_048310 [Ktedonobacter sp. SOSP1-52]
MAYRPVREMPTPPEKPPKKKPKLTTASFAHSGYVLVEDAPAYDPRQVQFMKKQGLQRSRPDDEPEPKKGSVLLPIGGGLFIGLLLLLFTIINVLLPAWNGLTTQWHYGDNHISHYEQSGHHFVGEVYRGFVTVYAIPEGHPEKAQTFMLQSAQDNAVVVFETRDVNSDGIPNVTIGTEGSPIGVTLYGTKDSTFNKQPPEAGK